MGDDYVYIVPTPDVYADVLEATRHEAIGEKAILEALYPQWGNLPVRTRKRMATDPV